MNFWEFVVQVTSDRAWLGAQIAQLADAITEANREKRWHDVYLLVLKQAWTETARPDVIAREIADRSYPPPSNRPSTTPSLGA